MEPLVDVERHKGVVTVRLSSPPHNVLDDRLRDDLREAIRAVEDDDTVGAIVITGGEKVFAAGADLKKLVDFDFEQIVKWNRTLERVLADIAQLPIPVIAAVNGFALGGGFELALAADFRILGTDAKLALPEVLLGIVPGAGGMQRLRKAVGAARAKEIIMTGRSLSADQALELDLAERVVPPEACIVEAQEFAAELARGPRHALGAIKQAIDLGADGSLEQGLAMDRSFLAGLFATRDRTRGMSSFLERGPGHARFGDAE